LPAGQYRRGDTVIVKPSKENSMREITTHIVEGDSANHQLKIEVLGGAGPGGANVAYMISAPQQPQTGMIRGWFARDLTIGFQNGPIAKFFVVDGVSTESLLAIVADRLQGFQRGPFACTENANAFGHVVRAMDILKERTKDRIARGVEGKLVA